MRKIILAAQISLDGFISGPKGELDWVIFDKEVDNATLPEILKRADTALLGRELYQTFLSYRPRKSSFFSQGEEEFARWTNQAQKIVFSTTLDKVEWNSKLVKENIPEEVAKLKQQPGQDMVMFGGVRLAQTFVGGGLVDEYWLLVNPVILGNGMPLFKNLKDKNKLKLLKTKSFNSGVVLLQYQPEGKEGKNKL